MDFIESLHRGVAAMADFAVVVYTSIGYWPMLFLIGLFFTMLLFLNRSWRRQIDRVIRHLFPCVALVWMAGVVLYTLGFNQDGSEDDFISVVPRAMLSALQMFFSQSNLNDIGRACQESPCYMRWFSTIHFAAAFLSALFLFKLAGFRARALLNLFRHAWLMREEHVPLNIFWGVNDASCLLAEDMQRVCDGETLLFVDCDDGESRSEGSGLGRMFEFVSVHDREVERLEPIGALLTSCRTDLAATEPDPKAGDMLRQLRLNLLRRLVMRRATVRFFFLSGREEVNVRAALNLLKGTGKLFAGRQVRIYVHARRCVQNRIVERCARYRTAGDIEVSIVDSSYLSVAGLKADGRYHPVNFVERDPGSASVISPFSSLIVGFGETGREALKFFREFGAFAAPDGSRSPFRCCVADSCMERLKGEFLMRMPGLRESREVEWLGADAGSVAFWQRVGELLTTLNCAVVALGDDERGISLAVDLYELACWMRGNDLQRFRIFVRVYRSENHARMREIAEACNGGNRESGGGIVLFGAPETVYTYRLIVDDALMKEAMDFNGAYVRVTGRGTDTRSAGEIWQASFGPGAVDGIVERLRQPRMFVEREIDRKIEQNRSNSLHAATKIRLLGMTESDTEELDGLLRIVASRTPGTVRYAEADARQQRQLEQLARCEHLRWMASHELLGYMPGSKTDPVYRTHDCLRPWEELDEQTRSYDCAVVDTTLKLWACRRRETTETIEKEQRG